MSRRGRLILFDGRLILFDGRLILFANDECYRRSLPDVGWDILVYRRGAWDILAIRLCRGDLGKSWHDGGWHDRSTRAHAATMLAHASAICCLLILRRAGFEEARFSYCHGMLRGPLGVFSPTALSASQSQQSLSSFVNVSRVAQLSVSLPPDHDLTSTRRQRAESRRWAHWLPSTAHRCPPRAHTRRKSGEASWRSAEARYGAKWARQHLLPSRRQGGASHRLSHTIVTVTFVVVVLRCLDRLLTPAPSLRRTLRPHSAASRPRR